jgi:pimeloyl-ACP methyl ester carboxylesterase
VDRPQTSYAWDDGTALAYQVVGSSGPDLLFVPGSVTHLEVLWEEPRVRRFLSRLAGFCRLILMDPRGLGLSDRLTEVPTLDERAADLLSVLDATGSGDATLFGNADTGPACIAAAVLHADRVGGLILCGTYAKASWSEDYPLGWKDEEWEEFDSFVKEDWGSSKLIEYSAPSLAHDEAFRQWSSTLDRLGASPRAVLLLAEMTRAVDVRPLLPQVAVPTLVMHRAGDRVNPVGHGRYLAEQIPGARWVELPGEDFTLWSGDIDTLGDEIEEFLTGRRSGAGQLTWSPRSCSRTWSARPNRPGRWATGRARISWRSTTRACAGSFGASAAVRSTLPVMASSPPSNPQRRPSSAPAQSSIPCERSESTSASGCTRASATWSETSSAASPSTSGHGSHRRLGPARSSCRRP